MFVCEWSQKAARRAERWPECVAAQHDWDEQIYRDASKIRPSRARLKPEVVGPQKVVLRDVKGRVVKVFERVPRWDETLECFTTLSEAEVARCGGSEPRQRQETRRVLPTLSPEELAARAAQLQPQALKETLSAKFKVSVRR